MLYIQYKVILKNIVSNISLMFKVWEPLMPRRKIFKHETVKLQSHYFLDSKGQYYLHIRNTVISFTEIKLKV